MERYRIILRQSFNLFIALLAFSAFPGLASTQSESIPSTSKKLLLVAHHDGDLDIYLSNFRTEKILKLTDNNRDDIQPSWSPDRSKIAYASSEHGLYEIYTMNIDGSGKQRITTNQATDTSPQWSPDGKSLVYVSDRDGQEQIYRYSFNNHTESQLTEGQYSATNPRYSPDGQHIAFQQQEGKKQRLKVMQSDGSDARTVIDKVSVNLYSWSPDSNQIAIAGRSQRRTNLYLFDLRSSHLEQLTDTHFNDTDPTWLPDGKGLVFLSGYDQRGESQVFRLDLNANKPPVRLTRSNKAEMNLTVSPDGKLLSFVRFENRFYHTYILDLSNGRTQVIAKELTRAHMTPKFEPSSSTVKSSAN